MACLASIKVKGVIVKDEEQFLPFISFKACYLTLFKLIRLYHILFPIANSPCSNFFFLFKLKYQDKMKELLADPSNQLQSFDTSGSIAWSSDDVYAKVMGKDCKGRIRGVGFGPSPSARSSKSIALTDGQVQSSEARDNEVAQVKTSLASMEEKLACFDEMKERLTQFEDMEQRMARMLQQMHQLSSQCNRV